MLNKISERQMHQVRWLLAIAWSILILSLFWDPISIILTNPNNTWSPYSLNPAVLSPETCIQVQGKCLTEQPYPMGARIFWGGIIPAGVIILFVFGHEAWRRICPLSFFSQIPRALGIQRRISVTNSRTGIKRLELVKVNSESWLGKNHLYFQLGLLFLGITMRTLLVNSDRTALGLFLILTILAAIFVGYWYAGKSWCHYFCPMAPVQMVYTGGRSVFGSTAHTNKKQIITQSMCRNVNAEGIEKTACVSCSSNCFDIDAEKNYWDGINKPGRRMIQYSYLGFVLGFYGYFFLYAGNWDYLYSGASNHDETQISTIFQPGFYWGDIPLGIPKLIAAPLTLGVCVVASYLFFCQLEKLYKLFRRKINQPISTELARHHIFALCTFISVNVFFIFSASSLLGLVLGPLKNQMPAEEIFDFILVIISSIWLYRTINRSQEVYTKESISASLRRQLAKLSIDFSSLLGGRSIDDLKVDEVYVLGKVLPNFSKEQSLNVYKGVLQEALENGDANSSNSLRVLEQMRLELNITEEEHYSLLTELGIENSELLSPTQMTIRERELKREGYRESLELLLLESIESGKPLEEILNQQQDTINSLQRQYDITPEEHEKIIQKLYDPDSGIIQTADAFLSELRELSYRIQLLNNTSSEYDSNIFNLIRVIAVENKQKIIIYRLLGILEMLKDSDDALLRAEYLGLIAGNILDQILIDPNQKITWKQRLHSSIYERLISEPEQSKINLTVTSDLETPNLEELTTGLTLEQSPPNNESASYSEYSTNSLEELSTGISGEQSRYDQLLETGMVRQAKQNQEQQDIVGYLLELLGNVDPLIRATALYGLNEIDPVLAHNHAEQILSTVKPEEWLLREVADNITEYTSAIYQTVPTLIVKAHFQGKVIEKVFQQSVIRIGSLPLNDLVINEATIAPQHCLLLLETERATVIDLASSHGIKVGEELIKGDRQDLQTKDIIYLSRLHEPYLETTWEIRKIRLPTEEKVTTIKKLLYLFENNFFHCLNPEDLVNLARNSLLETYEQGATIIKEGDISDRIFVILKGSAQVIINNNNQPQIVNTISPGETIGEMGVLTRRTRSASVVTSSSYNELLVIQSDNFEHLINTNQQLARQLILVLSSRLREPVKTDG